MTIQKKIVQDDDPSIESLLNTTVPQNLIKQNLGSRHEPTRRSLRHSRKQSRVEATTVLRGDPIGFLYFFIIGTLLVNFCTGMALNALFVWKFVVAPSVQSQIIEYFTGLIVSSMILLPESILIVLNFSDLFFCTNCTVYKNISHSVV